MLAGAIELGFDGLNVTHPVKQAMVPLVDDLDPAVESIGALNTVLIRGGRTTGHNTDVTGFRQAFELGLPDVDRDSVVLLGAGGAGTAVAHALVQLGVQRLLVVEPDHQRAEALGRSLGKLPIKVELAPVSRSGLSDALATSSGVWSTPARWGWRPTRARPCRTGCSGPDLWLADIVYRPIDTPLLKAAREAGCTVLNGAGMAVHQAADAFELITGRPADRTAMTRDFDDLVAAEATAGSSAMDPLGTTLKKGTADDDGSQGRTQGEGSGRGRVPRAPDDARRVRRR